MRKLQTPALVDESKLSIDIADGPAAVTETAASTGKVNRVTAQIRLVGIDATSALHTESNWRGALEHTTPQAAIMAVLSLIKRLREQTEGSPESSQKIDTALDDLVAAFKDRKALGERH
jgi:hypothetical protein